MLKVKSDVERGQIEKQPEMTKVQEYARHFAKIGLKREELHRITVAKPGEKVVLTDSTLEVDEHMIKAAGERLSWLQEVRDARTFDDVSNYISIFHKLGLGKGELKELSVKSSDEPFKSGVLQILGISKDMVTQNMRRAADAIVHRFDSKHANVHNLREGLADRANSVYDFKKAA